MTNKIILVKTLAVLACLFMLSAPTLLAQECCIGDFDCDNDVDGTDAYNFKQDFGRSDCDYTGECECPAGVCTNKALVPKTGQTTSYDTGDDGEYQRGYEWPVPRFTDNENGTVTDNLTGLIWLKDANCFGGRSWNDALTDCNELESGLCELTDGSSVGDWRLPHRFELESLLHLEYYDPAVPNTEGDGQWSEGDPFSKVLSSDYWTSNTSSADPLKAWDVIMSSGYARPHRYKTNEYFVWPVRGGL